MNKREREILNRIIKESDFEWKHWSKINSDFALNKNKKPKWFQFKKRRKYYEDWAYADGICGGLASVLNILEDLK